VSNDHDKSKKKRNRKNIARVKRRDRKKVINSDSLPPANSGRRTRTYGGRLGLLRSIGFSSYNQYLASDLWAGIRQRVFDRYGRSCKVCGGSATQVHHLWYSRWCLLGEEISPLVPLCRTCHYQVEFTPDGQKRDLMGSWKAYCCLAGIS
jgi:hypothetical protein